MNTITKQAQRTVVREILKNMPKEIVNDKSIKIVNRIIDGNLLINYNDILLYKALPYEVNLDLLIDYLVMLGKNVYLPRVKGNEMEIVKLPCDYAIGAYSILEPIGKAYCGDIDAVIVPVLAVDLNKNRLGKGKGYYDRYLEDKNCYKIAVAFQEQVIEQIITDNNDVIMDKVIVE